MRRLKTHTHTKSLTAHRKSPYHQHHTHTTPIKRISMKQSDKSDNSGSPSIQKSTPPPGQQPPPYSATTGPNNETINISSNTVTCDLPVEQEPTTTTTVSESSETPLSTAPTSPISNTSSSYKSGTLTDDANVAQGLQGVDNGEPQVSQRAAYGEQMVGVI